MFIFVYKQYHTKNILEVNQRLFIIFMDEYGNVGIWVTTYHYIGRNNAKIILQTYPIGDAYPRC